jgi:tetratricopeptide (TPR) repeat protein/O-antigen ligase
MNETVSFNDRAIEAGWLVLAASLPVFIAPWGRNPFELPKALLLWAVTAVMGAAWLTGRRLYAVHESHTRCLRRALRVMALAFAIALILSTLLSANPLQSAQGSYDRMQGAMTWLCALALFLIMVDRLREPGQAYRLLTVIAWSSAPVAIYGLLQAVRLDPLSWQVEGSPTMSTLGRSNFLGAYLVLVLPSTLACAWRARDPAQRAAYIALVGAQCLCLLATMVRAAWLGALSGGGVLFLAGAWDRGHGRLAVAGAIAGTVGLIVGLTALTFVPGLTGSAGARVTIWRATWSLIAARPIFGYGPETLSQVFTSVFPPELVYLQGRAVIVDRAHNLVLDMLASTGVAGLLSYATLVGMALVMGVRAFVQAQDRQVRFVLAAGLAASVGHLVETQLSFAVTTTMALSWLTLGMLVAPWTSLPTQAKECSAVRGWPRTLLAVLLLLTVAPTSVMLLVADADAGSANGTRTLADLQHSVAAMQQATVLWPTQPNYYEHLSWLHLQLARRGYNPLAEFQAAEAALDTARQLAPGNYRIWAGYGELYTEWGKAGDASRFSQAEEAFRQAAALFPGSAMLHTGWGLSYIAQGRLAEATAEFHRAAHLDHTDAWAYGYLGDTLLAQDDLNGAEQAYRNALRWAPDMAGAHRGLGHVYCRRGQAQAALTTYQNALVLAPDDPGLYLDIARCYWDLGQRESACQTVGRGLLIAPNHSGLLAFRAGCPRSPEGVEPMLH